MYQQQTEEFETAYFYWGILWTQHSKTINKRCNKTISKNKTLNNFLLISNKEMKDIMRIVKSLDDTGLLIKGVSQKVENETKKGCYFY